MSSPYPTLENLSLEWAVSGDSDADGTVTVRYRPSGSAEWRPGLALRRVLAGEAEGFSWSHRHAGSLFGLSPDTTYEVELTLTDPDGGSEQRTLSIATRAVPTAAPDAREKRVTPPSLEEQLASAEPGDLLLLADGDYDGFVMEADGSEGQPIVLRAERAGAARIQGDVRLDGRAFVHLERLTVNGMIKLNDAEGIVVRGCTVTTPDSGIVAYGSGSTNGYFCDNVVTGPTAWQEGAMGADGDNLGEGIQLTGPGNVICHNRVRGFRDCISTLEDDEAVSQTSIDVYGNDLDVCADDAVEADFTSGNARVYANRISRSFVGLSAQPSLGGPTYFLRNVMYNILYSPFKLHRGSVGDVAFHNTVVKCGDAFAVYTDDVWYDAWFRNNLFIGGLGGGAFGGYGNGDGRVAYLSAADASCTFDYDGYGSIGTDRFDGSIGSADFSSLEQMQSETTEQHAVQVDLSVFAATVSHPAEPFPGPPFPDLRLADGSPAIDSGAVLANINDDYAGDAPDLGAYELGQALPTYGPRSSDEGSVGTGGQAQGGAGAPTNATGGLASVTEANGGTAGASRGEAGETARAEGGDDEATAGASNQRDGKSAASGSDQDETGCGCRVFGQGRIPPTWLAFALLFLRRSRQKPARR